jgi:nucleotide-binding universal stress UspA family protein
MPRLVCGVDDSEGARAALTVASRLAEALALELFVLHVEPPVELPGVSAAAGGQERLKDVELADARRLLEDLAREARLGDDAVLHAEIGEPAERILAACADASVQLVALGSHGRHGLKAVILGSISRDVAARAPCPCVIVPPHAAERPFLTS